MTRRPNAASLLTGAALFVGPLALLAPLGLAPLLSVVAAGLVVCAIVERRIPAVSIDLAGGLALLCGLALLSAVWAIDPATSLDRAVRLVVESLEGLLLLDAAARLAPDARRRVLGALTVGLALTVALFVIDALTGGAVMHALHGVKPPTVTNRGATVLAILMWPALAWLASRGLWAALAGAAAGALGVALSPAASAHLALVGAALAVVVAWPLGRAAARIALVVLPLAVLAMPAVPHLIRPPEAPPVPALLRKPSAQHRLVIWEFVDRKIAERPLLGWGLESSRAIPGGQEMTQVIHPDGFWMPVARLPLHPHNGALQLWLELGAVGALLGAALVAAVLRRLAAPDLPPFARAAGLAAFTAAALEVSLSYGLWQSWWVAALWLAGGLVSIALKDADA
ncbi:MAG: hypothetical protein JO021_04610 [Alphaproteobacteria bacterium]|nr:hypothetical protein [Alphaproteobacteria bacterium]